MLTKKDIMKKYFAYLTFVLVSSTSLLEAKETQVAGPKRVTVDKSAEDKTGTDNKAGSNLSLGTSDEILFKGKVLQKKTTTWGEALQGVVEGITINKALGTLTLTGWSADVNKGKSSKYVTLFYKSKTIGSTVVNQPSPTIPYHFGRYRIPGEYSKVGFNKTFTFPQIKESDFDPSAIKVVAVGEGGDANFVFLDKKKIVV